MIRREGDKWVLYTHNGDRRLGVFSSKAEALRREKEILFFKNKNKKRGK